MLELKKLAIITTHPIQYNAPLFAALSKNVTVQVKVFYTWGQTASGQVFDPGFGSSFKWDLPLLEGYDYEFLENVSKRPGSDHFKGIINPTAISKLEEWKPDAILVYGWCFQSHLKIMRHFSGKVPIWFRGDSTMLDEPKGISIKKLARRIVLSYVFSKVDKAFYVGTENLKYYIAHGLKKERLVYAPHAIENSRFNNEVNSKRELTEKKKLELGIKDTDIVFLFVGKIDENKRPELLLESFQKINNKNSHLIFAGDGYKKQFLEKKYEKIKNIHFIGFQNQTEMPIVYNVCDVYFLVSKSETWGLALNEAMASGLAVVASSSCGGAFDLIEDDFNGWVLKKCDTNEISYLMGKLIKLNKVRLKEFGINSKKKIEKFSFEKIVKVIVQSFN